MSNSQSPDILSESFCFSSADQTMETVAYQECLISSTKAALNKNVQVECHREGFTSFFEKLLKDCWCCVKINFESISASLKDCDIKIDKLGQFLEETVSLLHLFTNFVKGLVEAMSLSCKKMSTFPVVTGRILINVFSHCKDSESIYGLNVSSLQTQLKDVFKVCHELQLMYLMVLEKHFKFDLTKDEEQDILLEALDINVKIGEIVESLDLKTMAEQWKSYTVICDKYGKVLMFKGVFENCTNSLVAMALKNINLAIEENEDQKLILRSLKVSNFIIKILMKLIITFKENSNKGLHELIRFLIQIKTYSISYLVSIHKPAQFLPLFSAHVVSAADGLLAELVKGHGFESLLLFDCQHFPKDTLLGYVLLLVAVSKHNTLRNDIPEKLWLDPNSDNLITRIFQVLPYCHTWFNLDLKFSMPVKNQEITTCGLYEYLLMHTVALASSFNQIQYEMVEKCLYEAVLGTDCCTAMFAVDMWTLLFGISESQLRLNQITHLCEVYKKLSSNRLFKHSPQQIHLSKLVESLYVQLEKEEKNKVYQYFKLNDETNIELWVVLKIRSMPGDLQKSSEDLVIQKLKSQFGMVTSRRNCSREVIDTLIRLLKLCSTCTFMKLDQIEHEIVECWMKLCLKPGSMGSLQQEPCADNLWYIEYVRALSALTETMVPVLQRNTDGITKILHIISNILSSKNIEAKLPLINLTFKLSLYKADLKNQTDLVFVETYKTMFHEENVVIRNKFYEIVRLYSNNSRVNDIITKVVNQDESVKETWNYFIEKGTLKPSNTSWKDQLTITSEFSYKHKCLRTNCPKTNDVQVKVFQEREHSDNFEFDVEMLLSTENEFDQPASKKMKLDSDPDIIIKRLENDASQLAKMKENITLSQYSKRIQTVCEVLKNITQ